MTMQPEPLCQAMQILRQTLPDHKVAEVDRLVLESVNERLFQKRLQRWLRER